MSKAILTCDLGFGDSGKGTVVDALAQHTRADLVVRYCGGAQAAHNVVRDDGTHHTFSQWVSGSLAGCDTLLSRHVLVNPRYALKERKILSTLIKPTEWPRLCIDEEALVTTPWHMSVNRCRDTALSHGSCGMGIGETVRYSLKHEPVRVKHLKLPYNDLCDVLEPVRDRLKAEADALLGRDSSEECEVFRLRCFNHVVQEMWSLRSSQIDILSHGDAVDMVFQNNTIFEGSQGVMLDEDYGFHPHTTWAHTTLRNAEELVAEAGVEVAQRLGIIRTYVTRHGAGPLVGEYFQRKKVETHNATNPWQQHWREAPADPSLWKYALKHAGAVDSLAVTHTDVISDPWVFQNPYPLDHFDYAHHLSLDEREALTKKLPADVGTYQVPAQLVLAEISERLNCPITLTSHGPRTGDKKICAFPET